MAVITVLLLVPAVGLWLSAALWVFFRKEVFQYYIEASGQFSNIVQALLFLGLPVIAIISGFAAYKSSGKHIYIYPFLAAIALVVLAALIVIR